MSELPTVAANLNDQQYNEVELPASIEIRVSSVAPGQPGAFSKTLIKKNTRFGPYKGEIIKPSQKTDIDYRYAWEIFEKRRNVLKYTISAADPKTSNWMRNVNCARFYEEQNIVSTQEGFSIFYVALKDINRGEELLTWFDPQLLKRTQKRLSRGERKKVGYTIELVPWSDEKKFVPEIIQTKRARKKKVLGDDMLSFEEDAALMQKSMNSMFRIPKKAESYTQPRRDPSSKFSPQYRTYSNSAFTPDYHANVRKDVIKLSPPKPSTDEKDDRVGTNKVSVLNSPSSVFEKQISFSGKPNENLNGKTTETIPNGNVTSFKSQTDYGKTEIEALKKRRRRRRVRTSMKNYLNNSNNDNSIGTDSTSSFNPHDPTLLKPVIIRTKENGIVEMEDHDETYNITWKTFRNECDDLCQCVDKQGFLKQENDKSSSIHQGNQDLIAQFTLLPEHQTFSEENKVIYRCDICEYPYNHAFSLKRHYLGIHINHRYISKEDIKYCQLETFHNGMSGELSKDLETDETDIKHEENITGSTKCPDLNMTNGSISCLKEDNASLQGTSHSLLCEETVLDSSTDDGKAEVPTLSSLARSRCEKNKSVLCSMSLQNQLSLSKDEVLENKQKLLQNSSEIPKSSTTENDLHCDVEQKKETTSHSSSSEVINSQDESAPVENSFIQAVKIQEENMKDDSESVENEESTRNEVHNKLFEGEDVEKTDAGNEMEILNERTDLADGEVESNNKEKESSEQGECAGAHENQTEEICRENGKHLAEEKSVTDQIKCYQKDSDKPDQKENCVVENKKESTSEEVSPTNNADKQNGEAVIKKSNVSIFKGEESKIQKLSIPQSMLPIPSANVLQVAGVKSPPATQQQFLLLVPIGHSSNKLSQTNKLTQSSSSSLPQNVVVLTSQVPSTTTTSMLLQPSTTLACKLSPQILTKPSQSIPSISTSSAPGQRPIEISPAPQTPLNQQVQTKNSSNSHTVSVPTALSAPLPAVDTTTPPSDKTTKIKKEHVSPSQTSSNNDSALKHAVKLEEINQPEDLYRCHMCVLVYKTMGELKYHIKNDPHRFKGGIKQYACPKCSVRFRNKANLARHDLMHHKEPDNKDRRFKCATCGKGFTTEIYLKMHARFHSGKSFPCKYGCVDAFFPNAGSLVKHLRAVHPGLNLKEYLREKKRKDRMKQRLDMPNRAPTEHSVKNCDAPTEYSMKNPGVGFQAKRGRPKGSKNTPKIIEINRDDKTKIPPFQSSFGEKQPLTGNVPNKNSPSMENYPTSRKYFPIEKPWQKGNYFFQRERLLQIEKAQESRSVRQRRFRCKKCGASFLSHLYLLKHRSRRHGANQSVPEFLYEMAKDREEENCLDSEELQFSPPPSPNSFFSNVKERCAENMSKYIEGGADMLKCRKKLNFNKNPSHSFSSPPKLEWTHYNFPPCFKWDGSKTVFYHDKKVEENKPKDEDSNLFQDVIENFDSVNDKNKEKDSFAPVVKSDAKSLCEEETWKGKENEDEIEMLKNDSNTGSKDLKETEVPLSSECKTEENTCEESVEKSAKATDFLSNTETEACAENNVSTSNMNDYSMTMNDIPKDVGKMENGSNSLSFLEIKPGTVVGDTKKGFIKSPKKSKAEIQELMVGLNSFSVKALDLEVGSKYFHRLLTSNRYSVLDSLNLISRDGIEISSQKMVPKRKNRERGASLSVCNQLLLQKVTGRSRDQISCSIFNSPDFKEARRYSMWQGPRSDKNETTYYDKFCCPVVESVRQQEVSKKRKEIQERNEKEVFDLKPKVIEKEEFADNMGLMSRREYERSYHAQKKMENCIKPPQIWDIYDRIWFGKKGTITVVCSICHRHFSCLELCLRHQLKKHPFIEPNSLEIEKDNYVEDMYYYYPMPYGILAQTHIMSDKMPAPELYVCTRCRFPFKNINKLHSHMVACDPNHREIVTQSQAVPVFERKMPAVVTTADRTMNRNVSSMIPYRTMNRNVASTIPYRPMNQSAASNVPRQPPPAQQPQSHSTKPQRQRSLNSKYKSYQIFYKSQVVSPTDIPSTSSVPTSPPSTSSVHKVAPRNPVSSPIIKPQTQRFVNYSSSLQRRNRNQRGLLYNPLNHTRRRELVHVLDQHQCHGCNLKFNSMSMLERHVKKCSGKDKLQNQKPLLSGVADEMMVRKQHTCRYCNKRFTFIKGVDLHYKRICSVRKIREEENKLTEEDFAHEAELQVIIERLKWSKSLNKDSSDIIQGLVKVEEDGTLTRVEKKRGRPFGKGRRIKRKGAKWTTLKYHQHDDQNDDLDSERSTSNTDNNSHVEASADPNNVSCKQEERSEEKKTSFVSYSVKPIPRKRGRPFKNRNNSVHGVITSSEQPKRRRGRPSKKDQEARTSQLTVAQTPLSLKDSINFKRGELSKENMLVVKSEKPATTNKEKVNQSPDHGANHNESMNIKTDLKPKAKTLLIINKSSDKEKRNTQDVSRKRKPEEEKTDTEAVVKPPARARGRPKKFDPSDLESSYKKRKKSDPGYIPLVKRTSQESLNNDSQTDNEDTNELHSNDTLGDSSPSKKNNIAANSLDESHHDAEKKKEKTTKTGCEEDLKERKESQRLDGLTKSRESSETNIVKVIVEKSPDSYATKTSKCNFDSKMTPDKKTSDSSRESPEKLSEKSDDSAPQKKLPSRDNKSDLKKRKQETNSHEDSVVKRPKCNDELPVSEKKIVVDTKVVQPKLNQTQESNTTAISGDGQTEVTVTPAVKDSHVNVTMPSTSPSGDLVKTPVAVRLVTLPLSSLVTTVPSNILSPSSSATSSQQTTPTTTVVSSPLVKLSFNQSLQLNVANKTQASLAFGGNSTVSTTMTTTTSTSTAKTPSSTKLQTIPQEKQVLLQPQTIPMAQVIRMSNNNLLIPPETIHRNITPRFIIQSSPKIVTINGPKAPSVSVATATTLTRHVSPSTVILSTGKVVSLGATPTMLPGTNVVGNSLIQQQGTNVVRKVNVINPITSPPPKQFLHSPPPRSLIRKGTGVIIEPPKPMVAVVPGSSPPPPQPAAAPALAAAAAALPKPVYYVQTSPLSNQVVMPISTVKTAGGGGGGGMNAGGTGSTNNQILLNLKDGQTNNPTLAVPQLQFIPVSLVQGIGVGQNIHPLQINTHSKMKLSNVTDGEILIAPKKDENDKV